MRAWHVVRAFTFQTRSMHGTAIEASMSIGKQIYSRAYLSPPTSDGGALRRMCLWIPIRMWRLASSCGV